MAVSPGLNAICSLIITKEVRYSLKASLRGHLPSPMCCAITRLEDVGPASEASVFCSISKELHGRGALNESAPKLQHYVVNRGASADFGKIGSRRLTRESSLEFLWQWALMGSSAKQQLSRISRRRVTEARCTQVGHTLDVADIAGRIRYSAVVT